MKTNTATATATASFAAVEILDPILGWKPIYEVRKGQLGCPDAWAEAMAYAERVSSNKEAYFVSSDREIRITGERMLPLTLACRKALPEVHKALRESPVRRTFERGWPSL